jgi:hypothetical protein
MARSASAALLLMALLPAAFAQQPIALTGARIYAAPTAQPIVNGQTSSRYCRGPDCRFPSFWAR